MKYVYLQPGRYVCKDGEFLSFESDVVKHETFEIHKVVKAVNSVLKKVLGSESELLEKGYLLECLESELIGISVIERAGWYAVIEDKIRQAQHKWHAKVECDPSCCKSGYCAQEAVQSLVSCYPNVGKIRLELAFNSGRIFFDFDKIKKAAIKSVLSGNSFDYELTGDCVET